MLHLVITKDFTYLNYLSVMTAGRFYELTLWTKEEPDNKYWDIVKKSKVFKFERVDPVTGITTDEGDLIGRTDIIYISEPTDKFIEDSLKKHDNLYEVDGEFENNDMCLVRVFKPEIVTPEYVRDSNTTLANLIKSFLLERVWDQ